MELEQASSEIPRSDYNLTSYSYCRPSRTKFHLHQMLMRDFDLGALYGDLLL